MARAATDTTAQRTAVAVLQRVLFDGVSLTAALDAVDPSLPSSSRSFSAQLSYGVLRWHLRYRACLAELMSKPLRTRDRDLHCLLLCALFELDELSTGDYAVVDRSVEAARQLGKGWASGLVNAVLRRYLRERDTLRPHLDTDDSVRYAMPAWLLARLREDWPQHWEQISEAGNVQAPMTLRVNRRQGTVTDYLDALQAAGIEACTHALAQDALVLRRALSVEQLPGFADGRASVQDAGAQLAAPLLAAGAGARVLDACAAPGGKACHVLEREPALNELVAVELDAQRAERVRANLDRLRLSATLVNADAIATASWWDGRRFDAILLDAPCSGSGVIRRHPDIKHLRRGEDMDALHARQVKLLSALWPTLAPGGKLLYVTCSVLRAENDAVVAEFLTACTDGASESINVPWGQACEHGRQLLPGEQGADGYYYARLVKQG